MISVVFQLLAKQEILSIQGPVSNLKMPCLRPGDTPICTASKKPTIGIP